MLPRQLRVGDLVDDYCPRERRLTDHAIVAMVEDDVRQVRCSACDAEHEYRQGKVPASRKKKSLPPLPPPGSVAAAPAPPPTDEDEDQPALAASPDAAPAQTAPAPESTDDTSEPGDQQPPAPDGPFHRRLIRAQLPRIEGAEPTPRPIPEFTMHKAATAHPHRHGRPFRPGQPGGGQHRPGGKGPGGPRHGGGTRHGQGQGHADGNTFGNRGGRGGGHAGPGGPRPARQGFGQRPPRGPKKH
jgi:hypothetical protein